jgi:hypothetical protein
MVRALCVLVCLWSACSTREGTVLIASEPDADLPTEEARDAGEGEHVDAALDAAVDTRGRCRVGGSRDGFHETFSGGALDPSRWLIAHGPVALAGQRAAGGFARDNVNLKDGVLVLSVRGDQYTGPVRSVDRDGLPLGSGKRSAAALVTRDLFASATYQVQGHFAGPSGVEVALWFARDDDPSGAITLATPGLDNGTPSYGFVRMQTRDGAATFSNDFALGTSLDDRASHILRFDWYTTAENAAVFWIDDERRFQSTRNLPSRKAGRMWIVAWLREGAAAPFETAEVQLEIAFVTPFGNDGDECVDGELEGPFLSLP